MEKTNKYKIENKSRTYFECGVIDFCFFVQYSRTKKRREK